MRDRAEELVRLVIELYGGAFARILEIVGEEAPADETLVERLAADDLVSSLLILHGLHPLDIEARITRALDHVRPYLGSHGGDVKLLGVNDGVVQLRLEGSCHGCPSSTVTMKLAIEKAIEEAAPEVIRIEVEGANQPRLAAVVRSRRSSSKQPAAGARSPVTFGRMGRAARYAGVCRRRSRGNRSRGNKSDRLPRRRELLRLSRFLSVLRRGAARRSLRESILTCPSCGRGYDVRRAGQCMDASDLHMEPLPLLANQGGIRIAVPAMTA